MICPKCKNEYREGFTVCADCGVALIEQEETLDRQRVIYGTEEQMTNLKGFMEHNGIKGCEVQFGKEIGFYELWVPTKSVQKAGKYVQAFMMHEQERVEELKQQMRQQMQPQNRVKLAADDKWSEPVRDIEIGKRSEDEQKGEDTSETNVESTTKKLYLNGEDKVKDYRSTGYCFTGLGLLGMVAVAIAVALEYLSLNITSGAMFVLFLLFFLIGIKSFMSVKSMAKEVEQSDNVIDAINAWCKDNLTQEKIDAMIDMEMDSPEMIYFERFNCIKKLINDKFMNLDQAFLDRFIDETIYEMVFGEE